MATAYDHLTPFQRIRYFCFLRLHELNGRLEGLNAELRMWNEDAVQNFISRLPLDANAFFRRQPDAVREAITVVDKEIQYWKVLDGEIDSISCPECKGAGKFRIQIDQDESRTETCTKCVGTGRLLAKDAWEVIKQRA